MIALETTAKIGKSPRKPQVELKEEDDDEDVTGDESDGDTIESEMHEVESADEGVSEKSYEDNSMEGGLETDKDASNRDARSLGNPGWADVMQQILRTKKPKRKKTIVLSKAKKLCDVVNQEKAEEISFEIEKVKEEVKSEVDSVTDYKIKKTDVRIKQRRKDVSLGIRVKPSIMDRERERMLQKIATKGVVQLFNAVSAQQGEIDKKLSEAGPLERKREKVYKNIDKRAFLDVLMGGSKSITVDNDVKDESKENDDVQRQEDKVWNVLRDDFVMGAKLKDWDCKKDDEDDGDSSAPEDLDSDDSN
ncbi:hypothetical protein KM043_001907 [Ampulex compressa]|nr:hypothetical protein KM043_001907 [Ampulex compressa]